MLRKETAIWRGTGRAGNGELSTDSGVLAKIPYSFKTRFVLLSYLPSVSALQLPVAAAEALRCDAANDVIPL